jgi:TRAP-type uncharacterized transport system substrate-binding protein
MGTSYMEKDYYPFLIKQVKDLIIAAADKPKVYFVTISLVGILAIAYGVISRPSTKYSAETKQLNPRNIFEIAIGCLMLLCGFIFFIVDVHPEIILLSGQKGSAYNKVSESLYAELKKAIPNQGIRLKETRGAVDNCEQICSGENDSPSVIGLFQLAVYGNSNKCDFHSDNNKVTYITPLYYEVVHLTINKKLYSELINLTNSKNSYKDPFLDLNDLCSVKEIISPISIGLDGSATKQSAIAFLKYSKGSKECRETVNESLSLEESVNELEKDNSSIKAAFLNQPVGSILVHKIDKNCFVSFPREMLKKLSIDMNMEIFESSSNDDEIFEKSCEKSVPNSFEEKKFKH